MKQIRLFISILVFVFLASCDERTGYYDTDQKEIISLITGVEWKQTYENMPNFEPTEYNEEGWVYQFNANGTGSYKWMNWKDGTINGETVYFRWTSTTVNYQVPYLIQIQIRRFVNSSLYNKLNVTPRRDGLQLNRLAYLSIVLT